ncbi:hypothetical protein EMIT0194P_20520 [Pseudomonas serbica]
MSIIILCSSATRLASSELTDWPNSILSAGRIPAAAVRSHERIKDCGKSPGESGSPSKKERLTLAMSCVMKFLVIRGLPLSSFRRGTQKGANRAKIPNRPDFHNIPSILRLPPQAAEGTAQSTPSQTDRPAAVGCRPGSDYLENT